MFREIWSFLAAGTLSHKPFKFLIITSEKRIGSNLAIGKARRK